MIGRFGAAIVFATLSQVHGVHAQVELSDACNLEEQFSENSRANRESLFECIENLVDGIGALRLQNLQLEATIEAMQARPTLPQGAVVAFDRLQGCPDGWTDTGDEWRGRVIVAAGPNANDDYAFRRTGGVPEVQLEIENMPPHEHIISRAEGGMIAGSGVYYVEAVPGSGASTTTSGIEARSDLAESFENMQPYVALYFCRRE